MELYKKNEAPHRSNGSWRGGKSTLRAKRRLTRLAVFAIIIAKNSSGEIKERVP
jgi:hypothetical protein